MRIPPYDLKDRLRPFCTYSREYLLAKVTDRVDVRLPVHGAGEDDSWGISLRRRRDRIFLGVYAGGHDRDCTIWIHLQHLLPIVLRDGDDVMKLRERLPLVA